VTVHVIRKYSNRRLYDPEQSQHVTLDQVRELIVSGEKVRVEDAKTGEDITRSILLQIIVEREESGQPLLTADVLEQLIRFYGGALQELFGDYLGRSVSAFTEQQETFQEQVRQMIDDNPMADLAKRNLELWDQLHQMLGKAWSGAAHKKKPTDEDG
jgi:polyhydroxyalkanoate synthesis repressor PhaR